MLRRLYDWTMNLAAHPHAIWWLAGLTAAESIFFPIPPDVLIIPMVLAARDRAWRIVAIVTTASVFGGLVGYGIGYFFYEGVGKPIIEAYGIGEKFDLVGQQYQENAFAAIAIAGFTPIPYKVFTIAAGVFKIGVPTLVAASLIGRAGRFLLVGGLIRMFGPQIKSLIDKYFNILSIAFVVLLVLGFLAVRMVGH